jgi:hypothetical protein
MKPFGLLVLLASSLTSCSSSVSKSDEILAIKLSRANELVMAIDNAISTADFDRNAALSELSSLCSEAETFTAGLTGDSGWEYPGDVPEKYSDALWTPIISCSLQTALMDGSISKFAEYVGFFKTGYACIRTGTCE